MGQRPQKHQETLALKAFLIPFGDAQTTLIFAKAGFNTSSSLVIEVSIGSHDSGFIGLMGLAHQGQDVLRAQPSKEQHGTVPDAFAIFKAHRQPTDRTHILMGFLWHPAHLPGWSGSSIHSWTLWTSRLARWAT
jgi:hypothetical protein